MGKELQVNIAVNLAQVRERIGEACARSGRPPEAITLVAVTKTRPIGQILQAYECGLRDFGENRVEELEEKRPLLDNAWSADPPRWHMIGHVQSRKAERAVAVSDVVHSVDSLRLAARLERFAAQAGRILPVLLELNVSGEASKYGFAAWDAETLAAFETEIEPLATHEHLRVCGLMTMAPIVADMEQTRPIFRRLREIRDRLRERCSWSGWEELSMGMTDDYPVAIEEGATIIRIGRAIFGPADY
ncbi:MAG: YggS family pyridoxal phosphate-dependent enzyme [Chloroflexi bacterium]|nr:YggS family pyridoxal phosphate-dependent enzyme [Chloroflexota bacterium]